MPLTPLSRDASWLQRAHVVSQTRARLSYRRIFCAPRSRYGPCVPQTFSPVSREYVSTLRETGESSRSVQACDAARATCHRAQDWDDLCERLTVSRDALRTSACLFWLRRSGVSSRQPFGIQPVVLTPPEAPRCTDPSSALCVVVPLQSRHPEIHTRRLTSKRMTRHRTASNLLVMRRCGGCHTVSDVSARSSDVAH